MADVEGAACAGNVGVASGISSHQNTNLKVYAICGGRHGALVT